MAGFSQKQLDEFELTRQGKNICECGTAKQMYFKPWCPICEKPKLEPIGDALNAIKSLDHIVVVTGDEEYKRRMWNKWIQELDFNNDSWTWWWLEDGDEDVELFRRTFNLEHDEEVMLYFSW